MLRTAIAALVVTSLGPRLLDLAMLPRSDQVLFGGLAIGVGLLWSRYRHEGSPETKLRLAALAALIAVVLLSVTSAMPWGESSGGGVWTVGQQVAGRDDASPAALELERWQAVSVAVRMGLVTTLALLLPALIWLLVEPRHRAAQAASAVGASVAGFTLMAVFLHVESMPAGLGARLYWTADLALLACATIVVASVLIVRQSFALLAGAHGLPRASAAYRRPR